MNLTKYKLAVGAVTLGLISTLTATGQTAPSNEVRDLPPNQTFEREIVGAEKHTYRISVQKDGFLQIRVEQKGVDVTLKLIDATGSILATMDSPNGKQGPETLSFVAAKSGSFLLEVSGTDAKAEKGSYSIRREAPRLTTTKDKRRVEVERLFVEGMTARTVEGQGEAAIAKLEEATKGWRELEDAYLTDLTERQVKAIKLQPRTKALIAEFSAPTNLVIEGQKLIRASEGKSASVLAARAKFLESVEVARKFFKKLDDESLRDILPKDIKADWKTITRMNEVTALSGVGSTHDFLKEWPESVDHNKQAITVIREMRQDQRSEQVVR